MARTTEMGYSTIVCGLAELPAIRGISSDALADLAMGAEAGTAADASGDSRTIRSCWQT